MIHGYNEIDYDRMAKKAVEKNIGYFLRRMSREGEFELITLRRKLISFTRARTKRSQYKWVYFAKTHKVNPWRAIYKNKTLGSFSTEELAHKAVLKHVKYIEKEASKIAA